MGRNNPERTNYLLARIGGYRHHRATSHQKASQCQRPVQLRQAQQKSDDNKRQTV